MSLTISSLYAGFLAIILIYLSTRVVMARSKKKILIMHGNDDELMRNIRAQANFIEYSPIFLIFFLILENQSSSQWLLYSIGDLFLISRILHAYSLIHYEAKTGKINLRFISMVITFSLLALMAITLIIYWFKNVLL